MGNVKRLYWLKLQKDFFRSKRIKKLRKIAGGDTYTIIYLKMQLQALNTDGILTYSGVEPTFAEEVALDIDEEPDNVAVTIQFLLANGMMEAIDDSTFLLPFVLDNTGSEGSGAARMRALRARKAAEEDPSRQLTDASQCDTGTEVSHCDTDVTLVCADVQNGDVERERDKDIDIDTLSLNDINLIYNNARARERETVETVENVENSDPAAADPPKSPATGWASKGFSSPEQIAYGSFRNVYLARDELTQLRGLFPLDYARKIETFSCYLAAHPEKEYYSHFSTILLWDARDKEKEQKRELEDLGKTFGYNSNVDLAIGLIAGRKAIYDEVPPGLDE